MEVLDFESAKNLIETDFTEAYRQYMTKKNIRGDLKNIKKSQIPTVLFNLMFDFKEENRFGSMFVNYTKYFIGKIKHDRYEGDSDVFNKFFNMFEYGITSYELEECFKYCEETYKKLEDDVREKHYFFSEFCIAVSSILKIKMEYHENGFFYFWDKNQNPQFWGNSRETWNPLETGF